MYLVAIIAALAGLLFGFDQGIISGAMLFIKKSFVVSNTELAAIVSAVPFGALIAAALCGRLNDWLGRKVTLIITATLYVLGSIVSALAPNVDTLITSRFILGLAVGLGSYSAPMYIAEVAKTSNRGALVTFNQLAITVGIVVSYLVDYIFSAHEQWRYMLGFGVIPSFILLLCVFSIPQSPRWLVAKGRDEKARRILNRLHGREQALLEMQQIKAVVNEKMMNFMQMVKHGFLRVLLLGIIVSFFTQAVGINAII